MNMNNARAEREHGHQRTYSLDTLDRNAVTAGLAPSCCAKPAANLTNTS
jgi:hypothetical protein